MSDNSKIEMAPIPIKWSFQRPGLTPSSWRDFESHRSPANAARQGLEESLGLPLGTINVLDFAFQIRLTREVGWDLTALGDEEAQAYLAASKIFRRGVQTTATGAMTASGSYKISFSEALPEDGPRIIDKKVAELWNILPRSQDLIVELDELSKNLETVASLAEHIKRYKGPVLILGGGVLGDTAGFAAAFLNRVFRLVPTTLLAMVDACVGGKTGVNFEKHGKNQLGLFAFPKEVIVSSQWLSTLPTRELFSGLAECYKHALITGDEAFAETIAQLPANPDLISPHLRRLIEVKAQIVEEDPNEKGRRAILNFGHTLAHALEKISQEHNPQNPILHGEALSVGLRFATFLSLRTNHLSQPIHDKIQTQLREAKFMPEDFEQYLGVKTNMFERLLDGIRQDKKNSSDIESTEWVLLKGFGEFAQNGNKFTVPVKISEIKNSWEIFVSQELFDLN